MRILIGGGGSGGHIFPALALYQSLKKKSDCDVFFVGSERRLDKRIFGKGSIRSAALSANKMPRGISPRWIPFLFLLAVDCIRGFLITLRYHPSVVVGFGGYVSFPVVLSGWILRIPIVIHEQNVALGRANRKLVRITDRIALSFGESVDAVQERKERVRVTGNPTRNEVGRCARAEANRELGLDDRLFTILVLGGSQGAQRLNEAVLNSIHRSTLLPSIRGSFGPGIYVATDINEAKNYGPHVITLIVNISDKFIIDNCTFSGFYTSISCRSSSTVRNCSFVPLQ